ncbi:MAG: M20/M25/M40 family metallo-hydrolase [Planctomycetota bacterium]
MSYISKKAVMMTTIDVETLLEQLIAIDSTSHRCNQLIAELIAGHLEQLGFTVERTLYDDPKGVRKHNLVARRDPLGTSAAIAASSASGTSSGLAYFAHNDVVPAGRWTGPGGDPFTAVKDDTRIFGRGACDMKGSLASMLSAVASVPAEQQTAPLWFVCTADEETHLRGAEKMTLHSQVYAELAEADPVAIIGEPTRLHVVHAHKGIVSIRFESLGRAAHSSTSDGINANVRMVPMLQTLCHWHHQSETDSRWHDDAFDVPTINWNFGFRDSSTVVNVVPDRSEAWVAFRPMPHTDVDGLIATLQQRADELDVTMTVTGRCEPLWTDPNCESVKAMSQLASGYTDDATPTTVGYATDGAMLKQLSKRIIFGPGDIAQAHTTDEFIERDQLKRGVAAYIDSIRRWC